MKLGYLTHMRLPTEKAYGLQMVNTVYHLSKEGVDATLIGTYSPNTITQDLWSYYGIPKNSFAYRLVWSLRFFRNTRIGFWINMLTFSLSASVHILFSRYDALYSREPFPLIFFGLLGKKTLYEMHDFPQKNHRFHSFLCRSVSHVAVTNEWARASCVREYGIREDKILLVPNGFDASKFQGNMSKNEARKSLGLPLDKKIILYSGHLYDWKGATVIFDVAKILTQYIFVFVGGSKKDHHDMEQGMRQDNVVFFEHQLPSSIPAYLASADVCVLPNLPLNSHSEYSTSPIKLFEYLASKRPVVASKLPSITSVVSEKEVVFVEPGNVALWAEAINKVLLNPALYDAVAEDAAVFVSRYSWKCKAERVIAHILNT